MNKHIEANAELAADLLRHMANNEIDSDYFAVVTDSPNCGREVQSEHKVTDAALMAAGIIDALQAKLEATEKELDTIRFIDYLMWHGAACANRKKVMTLETENTELKERAEAAEARLLVPVKFHEWQSDRAGAWYPDHCVIPLHVAIEQIRKAGYPVEGGE